MNRTLEVLRAARDLISDPKHWTQNAYAKNKHGRTVLPENEGATRWCAAGAIHAITYDPAMIARAQHELRSALTDGWGIWATNDGPDGHRLVLAGFDKAIARLEAKQGAPRITIGN